MRATGTTCDGAAHGLGATPQTTSAYERVSGAVWWHVHYHSRLKGVPNCMRYVRVSVPSAGLTTSRIIVVNMQPNTVHQLGCREFAETRRQDLSRSLCWIWQESQTYLVWNPATGRMAASRNVIFDEGWRDAASSNKEAVVAMLIQPLRCSLNTRHCSIDAELATRLTMAATRHDVAEAASIKAVRDSV